MQNREENKLLDAIGFDKEDDAVSISFTKTDFGFWLDAPYTEKSGGVAEADIPDIIAHITNQLITLLDQKMKAAKKGEPITLNVQLLEGIQFPGLLAFGEGPQSFNPIAFVARAFGYNPDKYKGPRAMYDLERDIKQNHISSDKNEIYPAGYRQFPGIISKRLYKQDGEGKKEYSGGGDGNVRIKKDGTGKVTLD